MRTRCLAKTAEGWEQERPADVLRWMWAHDSVDVDAVVIVEDRGKRFFCSNERLRDQYLAEGKQAAMFFDLSSEMERGR